MTTETSTELASIVRKHERELLAEWTRELAEATGAGARTKGEELSAQAARFLALLRAGMQHGGTWDQDSQHWAAMKEFLTDLARGWARQGRQASETATFIFSLKRPIFALLRRELAGDATALADLTWVLSVLVDGMGLFITDCVLRAREEMVERQQQELLELSTPVVQLWDGVLALPVIGTLDSARTQNVMENLLQSIVDTGAATAIIDITGVPTVDTLVAQHLLKTVAAARLMGADCIISGIRPQIAQTIVHLGVELQGVTTKATLAEAFRIALDRQALTIVPRAGSGVRNS